MNENVVVTGGAGFIGSHLCEYLIAKGNTVVCVDNLMTGKEENIQHLMQKDNFTFIQHDITVPLMITEKITQVYNLACPASPVHYQAHPIETLKANTLGVINALDLALKNKAKFLQASTSEVYGDPEKHPQTESYRGNVSTIGPRACYDESKRVAETFVMEYHRKFNLNVKITRIFNTYGPKMLENDGRVISNFTVQALKNEDITVYGDGNQTRSFCFVSDMVQGLFKMMQSDETGPINLGNPNEMKIIDVAKLIIKLANSKSKIVFMPLPVDDPKKRNPDISLAKKKLKWEPQVNFVEGLLKAIDYFKSVGYF